MSSKFSHHWFRLWLLTSFEPNHYWNQSRFLINSTLRNKLQWSLTPHNMQYFLFNKRQLKMSTKCQLFCSGLIPSKDKRKKNIAAAYPWLDGERSIDGANLKLYTWVLVPSEDSHDKPWNHCSSWNSSLLVPRKNGDQCHIKIRPMPHNQCQSTQLWGLQHLWLANEISFLVHHRVPNWPEPGQRGAVGVLNVTALQNRLTNMQLNWPSVTSL